MKKLLRIVVLSLLLSGNAYTKDFYISCEGKVKSISTMHNSTDDLFEEWKIVTADKKIFIIDLINSSHWIYRGMYLDKELSLTNNVLNINVYNQTGSEYVIKKYIHSISFNSEDFRGVDFWKAHHHHGHFKLRVNVKGTKRF